MALIEVNPGELAGVARRIEAALAVGDEVRSSHSALRSAATAAGRADVTQAIGSFLDAWSYGLSCINEDARQLAHLLRLSGAAYEHTEAGIVKATHP